MIDKNLEFKKRILELFDVDLDLGVFIRKTTQGSNLPGTVAGGKRPDGYINLSVDNKIYLAHRVLVFLAIGYWPEQVDHINGIKSDNRKENLRPVTCSINGRNQKLSNANKTGIMGVRFRRSRNSYEAYWLDGEGKRQQKNFSCSAHGDVKAKEMAASYRSMMIGSLNRSGAGYTSRHGES